MPFIPPYDRAFYEYQDASLSFTSAKQAHGFWGYFAQIMEHLGCIAEARFG
jgi:hypothetical protein